MSSNEATLALPAAGEREGRGLWMTQIQTIVRLDLRKNFLRLRSFWIYMLAFGPAAIIGLHSLVTMLKGSRHGIEEDTTIMAGIFQLFYLRLGIFYGCMGVFTRLIRGEAMERSLHYFFLAPVRREVLLVGKYLAGLVSALIVFEAAIVTSFGLMYVHYGSEASDFLLGGGGLGHLGAYVLVTALACIGYGALFLLMGILFKNPIIPAVVILLWESINAMLPAALKRLSVIFYLEPLCPVEVPLRGVGALFAVPADPISPWLAIPGLLLFSGLVLAYAAIRLRRVEIDYGAD